MAIPVESFSSSGAKNPAANANAITPADLDLTIAYTRGVYVGTTGDLAVRMAGEEGDEDVIFKNVPSGALLPIRVKQIRSTGTTATDIVAVW